MSVAAGKVGAPIASATTARLPAAGRSTFALGEAMPVADIFSSGGTAPDEDAVRDDERHGGGGASYPQPKARKPIIVSRFTSVLTSYEIDRFLFQFRLIANDPIPLMPMGSATRRYETNYIVLRYGSSLHGRHYNHLH